MKVAIKVGGSVFCPGDRPDSGYVKRLAETLLGLSGKHRLLVVVGGGVLARRMMQDAKARNEAVSADELHTIGIEAARMNASALIAELGDKAFLEVPKDEEEAKAAFSNGTIVVLGGFRPGQTTDAVTVQSAEAIGADLIIIGTDVKGVYDKDPKRHEDARFIPEIGAADLRKIVEAAGLEPGKNTIVDPVAARLIEKMGTRTVVLDVRDMINLKKAIDGDVFEGTTIR